MAEAAQAILAKQTDQEPWLVDVEPDRPPVHFGKAGEPGKWVTLDALRVLKRLFDRPSPSAFAGRNHLEKRTCLTALQTLPSGGWHASNTSG